MNVRIDALAALFPDEERASQAVTELARLGVLRNAIALAARSSRRLDAICERNGTERIESAVRHTGVFAELARVTGGRDAAPPDAFANDLIARGIDDERAHYFASALDDQRVLLVLAADAVDAARTAALATHGADFGLENRDGLIETVALRREVLDVSKRVVVTAEVTVRTEIVAERRVIELDLEREEFVIERRDLLDPNVPVAITRIPIRHEEASVVKTTIVTGEVAVRTETLVDHARIDEVVKHEILRVDDPRPDVV
ncbi:MAG: hypothetical protein NVSMB19_14120 [Vulcanimicrobiaceae bacterium]